MSDKVEVEVTGKSIYEVAHQMAFNILNAEHGGIQTAIKNKGRNEYLNAIAQAHDALRDNCFQ